jgi:molybdopterin converting factor small subunit
LQAIKTDEVRVCIKLFGVFRINRFKEEVRSYPPGVSAREVIKDLQLPGHLLGIVVINDVHAGTDDLLRDGDTLSLFPLLCGG